MTHEEEIKCDLITEVLTIIQNHTSESIIPPFKFVPVKDYPKMISDIEDLR